MPHTCPGTGNGEQPRARAGGAMGTSLLAQGTSAGTGELPACTWQGAQGKEFPPFTSTCPCVLLQP